MLYKLVHDTFIGKKFQKIKIIHQNFFIFHELEKVRRLQSSGLPEMLLNIEIEFPRK